VTSRVLRRQSGSPLALDAARTDGGALDTWRLAALLVPGLARGERQKLASGLGVALAPNEPADDVAQAAESAAIATACRARLAALPVATLQQLARLFAGSVLPEARLVDDVFRERARRAFDGSGATTPAPSTEEDQLAPFTGTPPSLQPARIRKLLDARAIEAQFSPSGALAARLTGYEVRLGQMRMARAVTKALNDRLHLLTEAGTGTGKSLAYLLPAVEYAVANGRRVVVSTNTINLQEQLFFKDIPLLRSALPTEFRAAVLKGRANYLCLRRWRSFLREGVSTDADRLFAAKLLLWLRQTETGDRGELALDDYEGGRWAALLGADSLHCTPQTCRDNRIGRCFLSRARRRAESAHILVVNHSLLLADQALENKVLPDYDGLILDEAHHVEDAATMQLGVEIGHQELAFFLTNLSLQQGPGRYAGLVSRLQTVLITAGGPPMRSQAGELTQPAHDAVDRARASLQEFFNALGAFARGALDVGDAFLAPERDIRLTAALRGSDLWAAVDAAWDAFGTDLGQADSALARIGSTLDPFKGTTELVDDALADLATARRQLAEYRLHLSGIVKRNDADAVCWLSVRERGIALHSAPLDVGHLLDQQLFSQKDCVVLTSATLQVGGSFRYMRERLGLDATTFTLAVPSPFDYRSQALLCVPFDLPDPSSRFFAEASHEALAAVCSATGGRTLILFTSHAALRAAHERLRRQLRRLVVLGQGLDGPRQQLLERFRHTPHSVLLGTSSFWEGIDVVGDALSCLVIVKLPFSVPNDPVFAARSELFADPFSEYAVPQAALRLKQGFGRLIRSARDRGMVAILDSRLWTKRYGAVFLRSLPPAAQHRCSWQELGGLAQSWLHGEGAGAGPVTQTPRTRRTRPR
jgi:DNA polymerase-3 subunit epsilon/ATP-dependent DNA helicase DinG